MKFATNKEFIEKAVEKLEAAEDKSKAIVEFVEEFVSARNEGLISEILEQAQLAAQDADYKKSLGLRQLSEEETKFYEKFSDIRQSITANQIDIIPSTIIDHTLDGIKKESGIMKLISFAPANVKKWLVASYTGSASWSNIDAAFNEDNDISATISAINIELNKMGAVLIIPKAIRELSLPFVDKYFTAVLNEVMTDGIVKGYLDGNGKTAPIGIMRQIGTTNTDGTNKAKTVVTNITKFSPSGLKEVRKTLTNGGKRAATKLYLICNPADEADYVDPALYGEALTGGWRDVSFMAIEKIVEPNMPQGKAIFTIENCYTMGFSGVSISEYKETKAIDDADLIIAKCYGNGRANDDNTAVVFDVTKLQEYVLPVTQVTAASETV